jgi:hypothetical protein
MTADGDAKQADTSATVATIALTAGGIAVAVGAVLWLTAPATPRPDRASRWTWSAAIDPRGADFTVKGAW